MPALIADIPVQQRFRIFVVQARHLGILRLPRAVPGTVQQQVILFRCVLPHRLIQVEQAGGGVLLPVPGTGAEHGILNAALVPGFVPIDYGLHVKPWDRSQTRTGPAHPVGIVERKAGSRAHIGSPNPRKQQPQAGVQAADGAHRGAGVSAQGRLVHHHGGRQVVDALHRRFGIFWKPRPHKDRVGGVHLTLGLGCDGVEHNTGFPGARHPRKHRDFLLWNPECNMF